MGNYQYQMQNYLEHDHKTTVTAVKSVLCLVDSIKTQTKSSLNQDLSQRLSLIFDQTQPMNLNKEFYLADNK